MDLDNPVPIIALVALGVVLNLGFFFVHAMTPSIAVTMFGTYLREKNPAGYWFWRAYHAISFAFNMVFAVAIVIGLLAA